jgi:putative ABC transport system permease protein
MKTLIKISWRNIWRSKRRSLIIMAAVSIGLWFGIFLMAFYNGMIEQRIQSAIFSELSHIQIHHPEFRKDFDIKYALPAGKSKLDQIARQEFVKESAGRMIIKAMLASAAGSCGITLNGVMPEKENKLTGLDKKITEGKYFNPEKTNEIIISERIAKKMKLQLNKKAIITFQNYEGDLVSGAFRIIGLYKTINDPYDDTHVFVSISTVNTLAGVPDAINEIAILLKSNDMLDESGVTFTKMFSDAEVKNWKQISPELGLTVVAGDQMVYIFMGIILISLAFGIVNTMLMSVLERTKEIGILMAIGMNKLKIFSMILLETFFLIMAGCPPGIFLAFFTIIITHKTGITLQSLSEVSSSFGYSPVIYPSLQMKQIGIIFGLVVITALFSAIFPARRALRLKPAESIKK